MNSIEIHSVSPNQSFHFLFDESVNTRITDFQIHDMRDTMELFWFLVKILIQGIERLARKGEEILDISEEKWDWIVHCFSRIGYRPHIQHVCFHDNNGHNLGLSFFIKNNDGEKLENYILVVVSKCTSRLYNIHFEKNSS